MGKAIRTNLISHLTQKGNYSPDVDDYLVDELVENIELCSECLRTLKREGVVQYYQTTKGDTLSKVNPLVSIYQMFQRNIHQLSAKLGINRNDRIKLKLIAEKQEDDFDNDFGS